MPISGLHIPHPRILHYRRHIYFLVPKIQSGFVAVQAMFFCALGVISAFLLLYVFTSSNTALFAINLRSGTCSNYVTEKIESFLVLQWHAKIKKDVTKNHTPQMHILNVEQQLELGAFHTYWHHMPRAET